MPEATKVRCGPDWLNLFRCFRIANDPVKVWFGFLGLSFTFLVFLLSLGLLMEVRQLGGGSASREVLTALRQGDASAAAQAFERGVRTTLTDLRRELKVIRRSVWKPGIMSALRRAETLWRVIPSVLVAALLMWLPWAYFGGAISRGAAYEVATGERLRASELRIFAASRYSAYLWPPIVLALVAAGLVLLLVVLGMAAAHLLSAAVFVLGLLASLYLGVVVKQKRQSTALGFAATFAGLLVSILLAWLLWTVRLGWLGQAAMVALLFLPGLPLAFAAVLALIVLVFGRGMMTAAVSFEGTEAFDAISRAGDYVLKRPWRLIFYWLIGAAYGLPCMAVAVLLFVAGLSVALFACWAGFGGEFGDVYDCACGLSACAVSWAWVPAFLLRTLTVVILGLAAGWCVSFVMSYQAICYALVRKSVDRCEISEIYREAGRIQPGSGAG